MRNVLSIAGSDCSGGAGIQADLKTMCALGVYGMTAITAVTVQNTKAVYDVQDIDPHIVEGQLDAVFEDIPVHAVKVGMVSNSDIIRMIRRKLLQHKAENIVVDPVMVSKSGYKLLKDDAMEAIKELISIAHLATPNIPEAELLCDISIKNEADMLSAAKAIMAMGAGSVLVKGGHRAADASDLLLTPQGSTLLSGRRIDTRNTHGTGCTLSSAIASYLARDFPLEEAVALAKDYITEAIAHSLPIGGGVGPVGHLHSLYRAAGLRV